MASRVDGLAPFPRLSHSAVATPHAVATEAAADVLADGGSAVDAAVTAAAVLCVVQPNNVALGSDLVALVRDPDGSVRCLNATGPAGSATDPLALRDRYGARLPVRGVDTVTIPGALRGWKVLLDHGGTRPLADLLAPAIELAGGGVPVAPTLAASIVEELADLRVDPGCRDVFLPGGAPLVEGDRLHQPALATTLETVSREGLDAFYSGDLADRWLAGLQERGSVLTAADLASYRPELVEPLVLRALDHTFFTSPPNTQGFALLRVLTEVAGTDPAAVDPLALASAFLVANRARDTWLGDPAVVPVDVDALLDPARLPPAGHAPVPATGDTVGIAVVSSTGQAVSLIQSVYHAFGSCVLEAATGVLFQNRGTAFSLDPSSPTVVAPGKRPWHSLMPVVVTHDDDLAFVSSTMGGQGQPQIQAQVLLGALAGRDAREAVSAPRFVVGRQDGPDTEATVTVERDVPAATQRALAADRRFRVKVVEPHDELVGHANLVAVASNGRVDAGSDPRSDGLALVVEPAR